MGPVADSDISCSMAEFRVECLTHAHSRARPAVWIEFILFPAVWRKSRTFRDLAPFVLEAFTKNMMMGIIRLHHNHGSTLEIRKFNLTVNAFSALRWCWILHECCIWACQASPPGVLSKTVFRNTIMGYFRLSTQQTHLVFHLDIRN